MVKLHARRDMNILEKIEAAERLLHLIHALDALFTDTETLTHRVVLFRAGYESTGRSIRELYSNLDEQALTSLYTWLTEPL